MTDYPLVPPPELVCQWKEQWYKAKVKHHDEYAFVATQAARWGSDQELEACVEWIHDWYGNRSGEVVGNLRANRRPKPLSLKPSSPSHYHYD